MILVHIILIKFLKSKFITFKLSRELGFFLIASKLILTVVLDDKFENIKNLFKFQKFPSKNKK